jgi:hypothetical protein
VGESTVRMRKLNSEGATKWSVSRWVCKNKSHTKSSCNFPDVQTIEDINDGSLGGLLLSSDLCFRILSEAVSLSDLSISLG